MSESDLRTVVKSRVLKAGDAGYKVMRRIIRKRHDMSVTEYRRDLKKEEFAKRLPDAPVALISRQEFLDRLPADAFKPSKYAHPSFFVLENWNEYLATRDAEQPWSVVGVPNDIVRVCKMIRDHPDMSTSMPSLHRAITRWVRYNFNLQYKDFKVLFLGAGNPFIRFLIEKYPDG